MTSAIFSHPLIAELKTRRKELAGLLVEAVEKFRVVKERELPAIIDMYDKHFRAMEIDFQKKTLEAAEIGRREELFRLKLERGEQLTERMIEVVHALVDKEFAKVRQRLAEAFDMSKEEREQRTQDRVKKANAHDESDFTKMYRALVKRLHPDTQREDTTSENTSENTSKNTIEKSDFEKFWHSTQEAYNSKNMQQMRSVYEIVCLTEEKEDFSDVPSAEEYLRREIQRLEQRLRYEERRLQDITHNEPYTLKDLLTSAAWIQTEQENFAQKIAAKDRDIARSKAFLDSIRAGNWKEQEKSQTQQKQDTFANDFVENTYFNYR